jgi:hypothetical protein
MAVASGVKLVEEALRGDVSGLVFRAVCVVILSKLCLYTCLSSISCIRVSKHLYILVG